MRNPRQFVGGFVIAIMMAAVLGIARPASADTGAPGGTHASTCGFLQGVLYKVGAPEILSGLFSDLFGCDF